LQAKRETKLLLDNSNIISVLDSKAK